MAEVSWVFLWKTTVISIDKLRLTDNKTYGKYSQIKINNQMGDANEKTNTYI